MLIVPTGLAIGVIEHGVVPGDELLQAIPGEDRIFVVGMHPFGEDFLEHRAHIGSIALGQEGLKPVGSQGFLFAVAGQLQQEGIGVRRDAPCSSGPRPPAAHVEQRAIATLGSIEARWAS